MKSPYVSELQPNQVVTAIFLVQSKDIRQKRTGEPCLSLVLSDRTGEIEAKMWDNVAEVMDTFDRDDFLKIRGLVQVHQNRIQLTLHRAQRQAEADVDFTDYFPASERNPDEMFAQLMAMVREMGNEHLRALLSAIFADEDVARRYKLAPAAKNIHHAYLGGLLEHVLSLCALAKLTAAHYDNVDADLLLAGVMLHDIGKIHELTYDRSFGYSSDGQLLGHIVIGLRMIGDKMREVAGLPAEAAQPARAHGDQPSRGTGVRLAESAAVSRGAAAASSRQSRFEDGVHARASCARTARWTAAGRPTARRSSARFSRRRSTWRTMRRRFRNQ